MCNNFTNALLQNVNPKCLFYAIQSAASKHSTVFRKNTALRVCVFGGIPRNFENSLTVFLTNEIVHLRLLVLELLFNLKKGKVVSVQ